MFIQTEATPNPATLKFLPGREVLGEDAPPIFRPAKPPSVRRSRCVFSRSRMSPAVFFGSDFITVTKSAGEWQHLKPALLGAIMEHFTGGAPILFASADESAHAEGNGENGEIVREIKEILDTRVRPAVAQDGGDITFQGYEDGIVFLNMQGACAGCPSSTVTLKRGVENMLKHYIPEIVEVRQV